MLDGVSFVLERLGEEGGEQQPIDVLELLDLAGERVVRVEQAQPLHAREPVAVERVEGEGVAVAFAKGVRHLGQDAIRARPSVSRNRQERAFPLDHVEELAR